MNGTRPSPTTGFPVLAAFVLIGGLDTAADERFPGGPNTITRDAEGANVVHAADLDGDGDADVLSASWGDDKIAWYENLGDGSFSEQRVLTTDADWARWVMTADLDGDGDLDVLSASHNDDKVAWHENLGDGRFSTPLHIATDFANSRRLDAADLDGDGDIDIAASGAELGWFENLGDANSWSRHTISTALEGRGWNVKAVDLDGDGDADVVNTSDATNRVFWHRNDGQGGFSDEILITTEVEKPVGIETGDLDGDGDLDVLSASLDDDKVAWYENLGDGTFADQRVITDRADLANAVHVADLDGDGDLDVLSASENDDKIAWYENLCNGEFSDPKIITTAVNGPWSVFTADLDGDGDRDVLSASEYDGQVAWYENVTPDGVSFAECTLSDQDDGDVISTNAHAADLDNDGDIDVISSSPLQWYENTGAGFRQGKPIAESADVPTWVHSADLDGDQDADPVAGFWGGKMAWYERTEGGVWAERTIAENHSYRLRSVSDGDLDGDGDLDLAAAWGVAGVSWHENLGDRFENRSLPVQVLAGRSMSRISTGTMTKTCSRPRGTIATSRGGQTAATASFPKSG